MSAVLRVPVFDVRETFADPAVALAKAQRIRDAHPSIDVLVDLGDGLDIPGFLDRRLWGTR